MVTLLQSYPLEVLPNGDNEIRTRDPLLARQVLSQLSYTHINLAATYLPIPLTV